MLQVEVCILTIYFEPKRSAEGPTFSSFYSLDVPWHLTISILHDTSRYLDIERMKGRSALGTRHVQPGSMMQFAQPSSLNSGNMKEESVLRCTNPKMYSRKAFHIFAMFSDMCKSGCPSVVHDLQIWQLCAGKFKQEAVLASSHSSPGSITPFRQVFKHTSRMGSSLTLLGNINSTRLQTPHVCKLGFSLALHLDVFSC